MKNNSIIPKILLFLYTILFLITAISPLSRNVWFIENLPIVLIVIILVFFYIKGIKFSNTAYILMSFLIFLHTIGGHFTFEKVPFDWFNNLFGFERNMYDRIAHFTVGFYAFPLAEFLKNKKLVNSKLLIYLTPLFFIVTITAFYELFEWWYAITFGGEAGIAFLGSQGDIWDAQKDMLMDTLGAIFSLGIFFVIKK